MIFLKEKSKLTTHYRSVLDQFFGTILTLLYTRLQKDQSDSYKTQASRFYHIVSAKDGLGADYFAKHSESLDPKAFTQFYLTIILPTTKLFARPVDRKLGVISYAKTLGNSQAFAERYAKGWGWTCNHMLDLLRNEAGVTAGHGDEIVNEADVDDIGFGIGFTPLLTVARGPRDEYPKITNIDGWVGQYIKQANQQHGGRIAHFITERLEEPSKSAMAAYLQ